MNKIITIIIATYNASKTLERCLNSIIPQLTTKCELIIVDGKSTDSTMKIVEKYSKYINLSISEKDKGIYDAWNKGIQKANGEWIMFIGADDKLLPDAISYYIEVIRKTNNIEKYDYICANNEYLDSHSQFMKEIGGKPYWNIMKRKMNATHVASLHNKKNLFNTIGFYDLKYRICADYELLLRKGNKLKYIYLPHRIAQMQVGGMSFSTKAIYETYLIRKQHQTVSIITNLLLFIMDWLIFHFFIIRKKIMGHDMR